MDPKAAMYIPPHLQAVNQEVRTAVYAEAPKGLAIAEARAERLPFKSGGKYPLARGLEPEGADSEARAMQGDDAKVGTRSLEARALLAERGQTPALARDDSYVSHLQALIASERAARLSAYEKYSLFGVNLQPAGPTRVRVNVPGLADTLPAIEPGDTAWLRNVYFRIHDVVSTVVDVDRLKGFVLLTWPQSIGLGQVPNAPPFRGNFNVRFVPSKKTYSRCSTALRWFESTVTLSAQDSKAPPLQGLSAPAPQSLRSVSVSTSGCLDPKQEECVQAMLRCSLPQPFLLVGPAGTGKTGTLVQAMVTVLRELPGARLLVCGPSHTAADVLARRLAKQARLGPREMIRLLDETRPVAAVPADLLPFTVQSAEFGTFVLPRASELVHKRAVVCTCADAAILFQAGITNEQLRTARSGFFQDLGSEMACLGMPARVPVEPLLASDSKHFSHLFIDEASQATEPETLVALSVVLDPPGRSAQVVLCGDPRQLSPHICSTEEHVQQLKVPLIERLARSATAEVVLMLAQNYRCHAALLMMPSALFYSDRLEPASEDQVLPCEQPWAGALRALRAFAPLSPPFKPHPRALPPELDPRETNWPFLFIGVRGADCYGAIETPGLESWNNGDEALLVRGVVRAMIDAQASPQDVAVLATFRGQVSLVRRMLRKVNLGSVNVGTIEDYQGAEYKAVVISVVRSSLGFVDGDVRRSMGLLRQPKRANVALTRAAKLLVIVGNPDLLAADPTWRHVLHFAYRNQLWIGQTSDLFSDVRASEEPSVSASQYGQTPRLRMHVERQLRAGVDAAKDAVFVSSLETSLRRPGVQFSINSPATSQVV